MTDKTEGKNINIAFADESPSSTVDAEDRTKESLERERIYDEEISPLMKQIIDKCREHKMPLFVECEYNSGDFCKTSLAPKEWNPHHGLTTLNIISQCFEKHGVNIDKYFMWIIKNIKESGGHSSMFLGQLGYKWDTGEYDWNQAYNMLQGAKVDVNSKNKDKEKNRD